MSLKESIYICHECKKIIQSSADLLFVEEGSSRGFCSEECIEDFYTPLITYYDQEVSLLREKHHLSSEEVECERDDNFLVEEISADPDEIWKLTSELKDEVYFYIKRREGFYIGLICTRFNQTPSFIFSLIKTNSSQLINEFRIGERLDLSIDSPNDESQIEEEMQFLEMLESKKSHLLGELLVRQKDSDISFEEFNSYEKSFNETLTNPDEIYELKDRDGDMLFHYLKSFMDHDLGDYFYVIVGLKKSNPDGEVSVYPILTFPTNDLKLFQEFRKGEKVLAIVKN